MCCFPGMIGQLRDQFVEQLRTETPICRICLPGSISGISSTCQNRALAVAASGRLHHGLSNGSEYFLPLARLHQFQNHSKRSIFRIRTCCAFGNCHRQALCLSRINRQSRVFTNLLNPRQQISHGGVSTTLTLHPVSRHIWELAAPRLVISTKPLDRVADSVCPVGEGAIQYQGSPKIDLDSRGRIAAGVVQYIPIE